VAQGLEMGMEMGKAEGIAEGLEMGKAEGELKAKREMALEMLNDGEADSKIIRYAKITLSELEQLKNR
jgi:flagellar biosynthesis/type III secretory pathway protein FliH